MFEVPNMEFNYIINKLILLYYTGNNLILFLFYILIHVTNFICIIK